MELQRGEPRGEPCWEIDIGSTISGDLGYEDAFFEYISRGVLAFAREACELRRQGIWSVKRVRAEVERFLLRFVTQETRECERRVTRECERHGEAALKFPRLTSRWSGRLLPETVSSIFDFHNVEWREYEDELDGAETAPGEPAKPNQQVDKRGPAEPETPTRSQKGDPALLKGEAVTFTTAEKYLGIKERQRQNLVRQGSLKVIGEGHNRKITAESLMKRLPPKKPVTTRNDP